MKEPQNPFIKMVKTPMGFYFYDVNKNSIVKIDKNTYSLLLEKKPITKDEYLEDLISKGYLSEKRVKKIKHMEYKYLEHHLNSKLRKLTLQITQQCNLKCKYCAYAYPDENKQRTHQNKSMSFDTAKKAIDFLFEHSRDNRYINIGFYGGEPFLKFDLIKQCMQYITERAESRDIIYSITTNGTILNDEIIEFIIKHQISVMVSFDGPKQIHNKNRVFLNEEGSFDTVINNIHRLIDKYPEHLHLFKINSVIDIENDFSCYNDFFVNFDIFKDISYKTGTLNRNLLGNNFKTNIDFITTQEYEKFKYYLYLLGRVEKKHISPIIDASTSRIKQFLKYFHKEESLRDEMHHGGPCIPGASRLFCDVNGNLFPCERCSETSEVMKLGNIHNGISIKKAERIINIGEVSEEECKNCWNIRYCNICAAQIDNMNEFSVEKKTDLCRLAKRDTLNIISICLMLHELGFDIAKWRE